MRREDARRWRLLIDRPCALRSAEYHRYGDGGSVADLEHRDQGSLLTLTVLLSPEGECAPGSGVLSLATAAGTGAPFAECPLRRGDGCLFVSEKRHNVSTVSGARRSFVIELWSSAAPNEFNRHS